MNLQIGVPSSQEGHVLDRQDLGNDTFVTVSSGHLVADRDGSLGGDVDLDHLQNAAAKFVAPLHAVKLAISRVSIASFDGAASDGACSSWLTGGSDLLFAAELFHCHRFQAKLPERRSATNLVILLARPAACRPRPSTHLPTMAFQFD